MPDPNHMRIEFVNSLLTYISLMPVGSDLPLSILIAFESHGMPCFSHAEFSGGTVVSNGRLFAVFLFPYAGSVTHFRAATKRLAIYVSKMLMHCTVCNPNDAPRVATSKVNLSHS